jgi:hypothetical protein
VRLIEPACPDEAYPVAKSIEPLYVFEYPVSSSNEPVAPRSLVPVEKINWPVTPSVPVLEVLTYTDPLEPNKEFPDLIRIFPPVPEDSPPISERSAPIPLPLLPTFNIILPALPCSDRPVSIDISPELL